MSHYLITGGSGFLGINLIRFLLSKGHKIRSLDIAPFQYPEQSQIEAIKGDICDQEVVNNAMKNIEIVVHGAAALPRYTPAEIYATDINGTENILKSAQKHNISRVIHISSTAVYGIPNHHPIFEDDPLIGVGPYGEAKIKAEEICLRYRKKGLFVSIIRPKSFIGPERLGIFSLLYDWAYSGKNFPILGKGDNLYQLLDVEDLCQAIYLCATLDKKNANDTFNIGAKEFSTIEQDFQSVLDFAGYGKRIIKFPAAPIILLLRFFEFLHLSPLYKWIYLTVFKESYVAIEKAEKILGFIPKYSNKQALIRNYQWFLENISNLKGKSGLTHREIWSPGIFRLLKLVF